MKINRDSWHYKLLSAYRVYSHALYESSLIKKHLDCGDDIRDVFELRSGQDYPNYYVTTFIGRVPINLCQYVRQAFIYPFILAFVNLSVLVAIISLLVLFPAATTIVIGTLIAAAIFIMGIAMMTFLIISPESPARVAIKQFLTNDNRLAAAIYDNYKNNVCTLVEVQKND